MVDLSRLMQDAAILEVIDKSADEASSLSAQNSYQAMRIEELERAHAAALEELSTLQAENERLREDAERYRFLKTVDPDAEMPTVFVHRQDSWGNWRYHHMDAIQLDAAIDSARRA